MAPVPPTGVRRKEAFMGVHDPSRSLTLSEVELGIRIRYRERATLEWLLALVIGVGLVATALLIGSTGWPTLAAVGGYSLFALAMAVRSGILLSRLGS